MGFFLPVPPAAGGATEKIWFRLAREFASAGHAVTLLSRTWPGFPEAETLDGVRMVRIRGFNHTRWLAWNLWRDARWGWRLRQHLPPADVVVCNTVSLPIWLHARRTDAGRVAVVLGRMPKGQTRWYGRVDRLLATSEAVAAKARRENPRLAGRIRVFPNPVDWQLHAAAASAASDSDVLTVGFVGRVHPEKGLELLLTAATRLAKTGGLPAWRLVLAGPVLVSQGGGGEAYRDGLVGRYGPALGDRLSILGPEYDAAKLAALYGAIDIFCYPSLAERGEGLSIAPIEAMAAAAVPVVSQLDCYRDLIRPGENGLVFDQRSPDAAAALAAALGQLLSDGNHRAALAIRAQQDARAYDYGRCANSLLDDFARLTSPTPTA